MPRTEFPRARMGAAVLASFGLVLAAGGVPSLLFGPWGGALADRVDLRRLLIGTQVAFGLLAGPDVACRWSLYLLLSLWPISIYLAARAFGAGRSAAAASASSMTLAHRIRGW